VTSVKLRS